MSVRLNVGVSRKVGLPDYGSAGATCSIDLEVSQDLLDTDLEGFHRRVRGAYVAARQAVLDELARAHPAPPAPPAPPSNHASLPAGPPTRPARPATPNQVRALRAVARRLGADPADLAREAFGVDCPEDLTAPEASRLIDDLRAASES